MKKIIIIGLVSLCAVGAYSQGTLQFYNSFPDFQFHIYAPNPANPTVMLQGDNAVDGAISSVSGPYVNYNGYAPIGGNSGTEPASALSKPYSGIDYTLGNNFYAQVYASAAGATATLGAPAAFSSLLPVSQYITTMATTAGEGAGFLVAINPPGDPGIPGTGYDNSGLHSATGSHILNNANVAIVCWYNAGQTINTLAAAQTAGVPWGNSAVAVISGLGEPASVETSGLGHTSPATQPTEMYGIQSFNIASIASVPEPSTIALGVMGACAFLARRRKK